MPPATHRKYIPKLSNISLRLSISKSFELMRKMIPIGESQMTHLVTFIMTWLNSTMTLRTLADSSRVLERAMPKTIEQTTRPRMFIWSMNSPPMCQRLRSAGRREGEGELGNFSLTRNYDTHFQWGYLSVVIELFGTAGCMPGSSLVGTYFCKRK